MSLTGIQLGAGITVGAGIGLGAGLPVSAGGYIDIFGTNFTSPELYINRQRGLVFDSSGNLYMVGQTQTGNFLGVLSKFDPSGTLLWQKTLGGSSPRRTALYGVDLDNSNNVYVVGQTSANGSIDEQDVQIAKYDTNGNLQWQYGLGSAGLNQACYGISVEKNTGDFYLVGTFLPATSFPQDFRGLIAKYDSSGSLQWQRSLTPAVSSNQANPQNIAHDSAGNIYVIGSTLTPGSSLLQGILVKYNSSGTLQWQVGLTKSSGQSNYDGITIDSSDNIYVNGDATVSGGSYGIIAKYNTSGALQWKKQIGDGTTSPRLRDITVDSSGNIYSVGWGGANDSSYLFKHDSNGNLQWQRNFVASSSYWAYMFSIAIDSSNNIVAGGYTRSPGGGGIFQILMLKVPNDGTPVGTYTNSGINFTYSTSSLPQSDLSAWSTTTPTLSSGTPSFTASGTSLTSATSTFTNTVTAII